MGGTSATDADPAGSTAVSYGTIVVIGGGCYGSYYVRQLTRARQARALVWASLVVVDRDPHCAVALHPPAARPPGLTLAISPWDVYLARFLADAAETPGTDRDAIVPSPLMPHLLADWLVDRARARWPHVPIRTESIDSPLPVPWQRDAEDGTRYVSFAEWICPINCIEPARCPHTRGPRSWSLPPTLRDHAESERSAGRPLAGVHLFHCTHRAYGVGMIDVADVVRADAAIGRTGLAPPARYLLGTVSHCHGAVRRVVLGA